MATLTHIVDWIAAAAGTRETAGGQSRCRGGEEEFRLRALPNEDIHFWVREVDNSRIIPRSDPQSTKVCVKLMVSACLTVLVLFGVLVPTACNILAGYRINALEQQREMLLRERYALDLQEAQLLSPARLAELGRLQQLVDPAPETVIALGPVTTDGALAMNR
jgi:hypothetical protein